MTNILAYPLQWPDGWPRTKEPEMSRFDHKLTLGRSRDEMIAEIQRMNGQQIIVSTNIPLRKDGLPYASYKAPKDTGVAVYFMLDGQPKVFACDKWYKIEDNMRAIKKTIEAIRGIERWGSSEIMDRIYRGFQALPEKSVYTDNAWWVVLGVSPDANSDEIKKAYRMLVKTVHTDIGGDTEQFQRVNEAYAEAEALLRSNDKW